MRKRVDFEEWARQLETEARAQPNSPATSLPTSFAPSRSAADLNAACARRRLGELKRLPVGPDRKPDDRRLERSMDQFRHADYPRRHREALRGLWDGSPSEMGPHEWLLSMFSQAQQEDVIESVNALSPEGGTILLLGDRGRGKTFLATALAVYAMLAGLYDRHPAGTKRYWTLATLFRKLKSSFDDRRGAASFYDLSRNVGLLALDEIQDGLRTDWKRVEFTELVNHRYEHRLRTILVANLRSMQEADTVLGRSVTGRVMETGTVLELRWPNTRARIGAEPVARQGTIGATWTTIDPGDPPF